MIIKASVGSKRKQQMKDSTVDVVRHLEFRSEHEPEDTTLLAAISRVYMKGGTIIITPKGEEPTTYHNGGMI